MKCVKRILLTMAVLALTLLPAGCGVLSENLAVKKLTATKSTITITFDAVTSANYDTYELREYGVAYSTDSKYLNGADSNESQLTPKQNYPRARVKSVVNQPTKKHGKRELVTLTVTINNLKAGTTYYFKPYVYGSYYNTGEELKTSYGYGGSGNLTTLRSGSGSGKKKSSAVKPRKVTGVYARGARRRNILSWSPTPKASGYEVYVSGSRSGKYRRVKTTRATQFIHKRLKPGKTYYYKVRAYNKKNGKKYGSFSRVVRGRVKR